MLAFVAFCYLLPNLTIPILDTETPWASILFSPIALYVLAAIGLNIVVGYAGLLDLGYVAFYAIGAYTVGVLTSAHGNLAFWEALPIAIALAMLAGVLLGHADVAAAGRLPRDRHARFRRDHPHRRPATASGSADRGASARSPVRPTSARSSSAGST